MSVLHGPLRLLKWLTPAVADWRLMLKGPAHAERGRLRQAWIDRWPALEAAYVAELGWTDTNLLHDRHDALADSVASLQLAIRRRSEEHTSQLQSPTTLVCPLL